MNIAGRPIVLAILLPLSGVWSTAAGQTYSLSNLTAGLADAPQSWATDVNNAGQVTGTFLTDGFKRTHGFVWADGQIVETIIAQPATSGVTPSTGPDAFRHVSAQAINDRGEIVATQKLPSGQRRAVLLTPAR